jgi:hypothetical protein
MMRVRNLQVRSPSPRLANVSENSTGGKSGATRTSNNPFETLRSAKSQSFINVVKDKRTKNNNLEFFIGWRDFPNPIHDTWKRLNHSTGSEHMIREIDKKWEQDYLIKTAQTLQTVTDRRI